MSKVKHFLRKLHIGDHNHHGRPPSQDPSPQSSSSQPSPSFDLPQTSLSSENENSTTDGGFIFFEEEFELQLALAISVSDQGRSGVDSETAQIDAAKKISLGRTPSQNLGEFLSLRYWCHDVLNYDEKVFDGFYDVCGMNSKLDSRSRIPSLQELKAASLLDDIDQEVVLVNRSSDVDLRKLEERVYLMSLECCSLDKTLNTSLLVQRIADLIVDKMGGPVVDVEDMFRRWRLRNKELRIHLNTVILPLGSLDIGHSRQRALLFKVLADRINLPCKLVKGSYYTGTDEGAVNLVKLDDGSEYIIDLMGAPGSLIPSEVPSPPPLNASDTSAIVWNEMSSSMPSDMGGTNSFLPDVDEFPKVRVSQFLPAKIGSSVRTSRTLLKTQTEQLSHEYEVSINSGKRKWLESTSYFGSDEPVLNGESHTALLDKCVASSDTRPYDFKVDELVGKNSLDGRGILCGQRHDYQDEYSRLPLNEFQKSDTAYIRSREFSNEPLRENLFDMWGGGNALSSSVLREQNVPVTTVNDFDAAGSSDDSTCRVQNFQIDSMIDGVAEILWEDLRIGERIGIGSYGEVYRAEWNGTEVAAKKFMNQEISGDALAQFKCEVEIMLRLRHPNVVLFMGAVTRPPNMSILTEFLPRGSLYKLLHRPNTMIDEKRRIKMALDVAKGMKYLHTSHPTIVHRDLKSPNLLVDKNWVVKVCDFGMSRLQHHTFLSSKSAAGTAEWMAPEVLRNEPSNEKSDVYSYGVILWELATLQVPWAGLNSMQVVGAVGFQGRHLKIPATVDPTVAEIINDCWNINTWDRPSFAQIIARLKSVQCLTIHPAKNCEGRL